ncbi:MAG: inositol monophosphatase family protein [Thermoleophilaceae bacterium]|jgi:myo-inositol-1(or 4)-monophosphatase
MTPDRDVAEVLEADWLALCRRSARSVEDELRRRPDTAERARTTGRGQGGDMTLAIDGAAEDAVFAELEELGAPVTAVSEERGHVMLAGGGPVHVVIDPIDGSLNAKRGLPMFGLSIAIAGGATLADVEMGFVADLANGEEWWARRGDGAFLRGQPLPALEAGSEIELLGVDSATPRLVAAAAPALQATGARRLRALGSIALHLCHVASGRLDAMLSLAACRSVDAAAGQLVVREVGGAVAFPDAGDGRLSASLDLAMRSRVVAARDHETLGVLLAELP